MIKFSKKVIKRKIALRKRPAVPKLKRAKKYKLVVNKARLARKSRKFFI